MPRENLNDLQAFVHVAREGSFTKAAAQLGVSQSALSHAMRGLEQRLGVRLLTRTTRSVSTTEAGARLLDTLGPRLAEIEDGLAALAEYRERPAGTIRINATGHAAEYIAWPRLAPLLQQYPDLKVELAADYGLADIVAERYDIGIRLGERLARDMVAVPISPPLRMRVVGAPGYFRQHVVPRHPDELADHNCVTLRLPTHGGLMPWDFGQDGNELSVRVSGQWTFNTMGMTRAAALAGSGLAWLPEDQVQPMLDDGRLQSVLDDWCPHFDGYYAYYPSRRHVTVAMRTVLDALRELSRLSPVVFACARDGDVIAAGLIDEQAEEIATMAVTTLRRLDLLDRAVPVVLGGGVIGSRDERLLGTVERLLAERAPMARMELVTAAPILGAALLALESAGASAYAVESARSTLTERPAAVVH